MLWLLIGIIIVLLIYIVSLNRNNPQQQLANLKEWLDGRPEEKYLRLQSYLKESFSKAYGKEDHSIYLNKKEFDKYRSYDLADYHLNDLWRRHIATIIASDQYSIESKMNAAQAWSRFIFARARLIDATEGGWADSESMDEYRDAIDRERNLLKGIFEAFNFDVEKEAKEIEETYIK